MTRNRCRAAFEDWQIKRAAYPLPFGDYKLREALSRMEQYLNNLDDVARLQRAKQAKVAPLRPQVPEGGSGWIMRIPEAIAFDFGYNVLPGVEALVGQGLPPAKVGQLTRLARARADDLIMRCDRVRHQLHIGGIAFEFSQMRNGGSLVRPLLLNAIDLIRLMLEDVTAHASAP